MELEGLTLLVVEDDPDARELMQAVLETRGARVFAAEGVAQAFELLEEIEPTVIVSDIAMPDEDGIAFVRRLRARAPEDGGSTPTIAVSAYVAATDRHRALAAGFDRYLHKPIDFDELVQTILAVRVNLRSGRRPADSPKGG
jgi:CheY-like chemotaxis protein